MVVLGRGIAGKAPALKRRHEGEEYGITEPTIILKIRERADQKYF